jgi:hypothetical protein
MKNEMQEDFQQGKVNGGEMAVNPDQGFCHDCADLLTRPRNRCVAHAEDQMVIFDLFDVEEINRRHPSTFYVPSNELRTFVKPGMQVKIYAEWSGQEVPDERFWVKVSEIRTMESGERLIYGTSLNETICTPYGAHIGPIKTCNICDIDAGLPEEQVEDLVNSNFI